MRLAMQSLPLTAHTPSGAEPGHQHVPALGLHANRHIIADGASITIRKDDEENDRRDDDAECEESDKDDGEYHWRHIQD